MKHIKLIFELITRSPRDLFAQAPQSSEEFFKQQLAAAPGAPAPSYETLLSVTDKVSSTSAKDLKPVVPWFPSALKRDKDQVAIEAEFVIHTIAHLLPVACYCAR